MTYGEQIMRLRHALDDLSVFIEIQPWLPPAAVLYTGYETLGVKMEQPE
jgi:hypothetical protein